MCISVVDGRVAFVDFSCTFGSPYIAFTLKFSSLLTLDEIETLHHRFDYTALHIYAPLKAYLEQTSRWIYDGNGRWSTSDMMARLRSNGEKFHLEVWHISGNVKRVRSLEVEDTNALVAQLRRIGI